MLRISLPERIPMTSAFLFAAALFLLQQVEHTSLYFSACSFLFIVIATYAFNVAGGLTRPSGGYIFCYSVLAVILGLTVKVFTGQRGDSNLLRPHLTITIYAVSSVMLLLTAAASRKFSRKRPLLENLVGDNNLQRASIGALAFGIFLTVATRSIDRGSGSLWSALLQINRFCELAIILGVTDTIRKSGGRRSVNATVLIGSFTLFVVGGLFGFSKESIFTPIVCWGLAAGAQRYRLTRGTLLTSGLCMFFLAYYMVPYSQYGRTQMRVGLGPSLGVAFRLLSDLPRVRAQYAAQNASEGSESLGGYFGKSEGIFDRLQMIEFDDMLNDATERTGVEGYYPILQDFENLIPHFFWPGKPVYLWGNVYAHEAGINIAEDDFYTGISFSPTGEAYHLGKWAGVIVAGPLVWLLLFLIMDSLCGDVRASPWGLLAITYFAHIAPEGLLAGAVYAMGFVTFAIAFAAVTSGYVMPILGGLFIGPGGSATKKRLMLNATRPARVAELNGNEP